MAKAILKVFLSFIASIVGIILAPIDLLLANAFPDLSSVVSTAQLFLTRIFNYSRPYLNLTRN